jgi:hypothetical protein
MTKITEAELRMCIEGLKQAVKLQQEKGLGTTCIETSLELYTLALAGIAGEKDSKRLDWLEAAVRNGPVSTRIDFDGETFLDYQGGPTEVRDNVRAAIDAAIAQGEGVKS